MGLGQMVDKSLNEILKKKNRQIFKTNNFKKNRGYGTKKTFKI